MIFTSQAWNMTFAFYASVKGVPRDLSDVSSVMGLSWWQRLVRVELPLSLSELGRSSQELAA